MNKELKCCEKCSLKTILQINGAMSICTNANCTCHAPKEDKDSWEIEFEKAFGFPEDIYSQNFKEEIKSFIRSQKALSKAEGVEEENEAWLKGERCMF